jgi:tRNA G18 (ribose-2'-O)-methylase SpoU
VKVTPFGLPRDEIKRELEALRHPFSVAVERAKNPFNIGSIVRTAHSFMAREIVLVGTEPWYERAAMGMQRYETLVELPDAKALIERVRAAGHKLVVFERESASVGLWEAELPDGAVLVFGNEDSGVSAELVEAADEIVAIPMFGINNSYPITVAAGIAMAEWARRRYSGGRLVPAPGLSPKAQPLAKAPWWGGLETPSRARATEGARLCSVRPERGV